MNSLHRSTLAALLCLATPLHALALPSAPSIVSGTATFSSSGSILSIAADSAMIDWSDFQLASGESINITQGTGSAGVDLRVTGDSNMEIFGSLWSNGPLTLRADYILVGAQGRIETLGLSIFGGHSVFVDGLLTGAAVLNINSPDIVINGPIVNNGVVMSTTGVITSGSLTLGSAGGSFRPITGSYGNMELGAGINNPGLGVAVLGVPEPSAWLMLALGLGTLVISTRRARTGGEVDHSAMPGAI